MSHKIKINNAQIAALLGKDEAVTSRMASKGNFGKPSIHGRCKYYRLEAIERAVGRRFSVTEIEAAKAKAAQRDTGPPLTEILRRFISLLLARRDAAWLVALHEQNITDFTPPAPNRKSHGAPPMSEHLHAIAIANSETIRSAEIAAAPNHAAINLADQEHFRRVIASAAKHGMSAPNAQAALDASLIEPEPYKAPANWP